jgi:predicted glutamine amidotransferase
MCRLLGVVTGTPVPLAESLGSHAGAFRELSAEHCHGWGAAHTGSAGLTVVRHTTPAREGAEFAELAARETDAAVLHIRLASPGMPLRAVNTHPFSADGAAFVHNGHFLPPDVLDGLAAEPQGNTDSERYFLRVLALLRDHEPPAAIAAAAAEIAGQAEFSSLNCLLLTEQALYAYTQHDPDSPVSRRRGADFFDLRYRVEPGRVLVGSTGWPQDGWQVLPQRHVLEIERKSLRVAVHAPRPHSSTMD